MSLLRGKFFGPFITNTKLLSLLLIWVLVLLTLFQILIGFNFNNFELEIVESPRLTEDKLLEEVQNRMPNIPIIFWNKYKQLYINSTCAKFPSIFDLEINNIYWQTLRTSNGTFQLYGAYYDTRKLNSMGATIRILGMINMFEPIVTTHCQIWYDGKTNPLIVKTYEYRYIWVKEWATFENGIYQPYLIACQIPENYRNLTPNSVSLAEKPCDNTTNNLRVIYDKPKEKKDFAVCVKGLDFLHEDLSVRLVEWIELLGILGADKIFFYELQVHPNITKVLNFYEKTGQIHVTPISLAGGQPNVPFFQHLYLTKRQERKRINELISYNDCLYKNMYKYKYIVLLDIDEIIIPLSRNNWKELVDMLMDKVKVLPVRDCYNVRHIYFLDDFFHSLGWFKDIPKYMHMLQHVYRTKNFTIPGQRVKCFLNTERVLTLHNHYPLSCLAGKCTSYRIKTEDAQLQHYRRTFPFMMKKLLDEFIKSNSVIDTTIWKYKYELSKKVISTLKSLGYF